MSPKSVPFLSWTLIEQRKMHCKSSTVKLLDIYNKKYDTAVLQIRTGNRDISGIVILIFLLKSTLEPSYQDIS